MSLIKREPGASRGQPRQQPAFHRPTHGAGQSHIETQWAGDTPALPRGSRGIKMHPVICTPLPIAAVHAERAKTGGQPLIFDVSAHPLPSSVSQRHCVHDTPKTDILNEATILLKTKGRKAQFSLWRSRYIIENRAVTKR